MAPPADEPAAIGRLAALLAPTPGRAGFALRQAMICALVALVTAIYQSPEAALTIYVVFFLNKGDRVESVILNLVFVVLISLIIGLVLLLSLVIMDWPLGRVAAITAISMGLLFLASTSKLRPVGATVALIVGFGLDELGSLQIGEVAVRALLYAWGFVAIPAAVSLVVNLLAAPSPRDLLLRALAVRLRLCAAEVRVPNGAARAVFADVRDEGSAELDGLLRRAAVERSVAQDDRPALRAAIGSSTELLLLTDLAAADPPLLDAEERAAFGATLEEMAHILASDAYPVDVRVEREATPRSGLGQLFEGALRGFAVPNPDAAAAAAAKPAGGFFLPDAFSNPEHVQYALKTTTAAMLCYMLYQILDWPGIHTCFITCYIVALGTAAETIEKLTLRILGCLVGAAAGYAAILLVLPDLTSIGALMAVVFAGALASAWVAAGSARIAYAGFQIAFAFFLCVVQGPSPAFDLSVARDRVIGILIGNLVSFVIFTQVWPVSVSRRVDPGFAALLRQLAAMLRASTPAGRRALAGQALTTRQSLDSDLTLVRYEPASLRPTEAWLARRRRAGRVVGSLIPRLFLSGNEKVLAEESAARLEAMANALDGAEAPAAVPVAAASPLRDRIMTELDSLGADLAPAPADPRITGLATA